MPKQILYLGLDPTYYVAQGKVTHWPIIQIVPRPLTDLSIQCALRHFASYSHILITSKTTVAILREYLPQVGINLQVWAKKATLAVGQVTAQHLQACGIIPINVAQEETAEGLIEEIQRLSIAPSHLFWPHSAQARPVIKNFLVTQGLSHTTCILYDSSPHQPSTLPLLENFDEIVFTSPSTVKAFLQIFGQFPSRICLKAIGPITAQFLEEHKKLKNNSNNF